MKKIKRNYFSTETSELFSSISNKKELEEKEKLLKKYELDNEIEADEKTVEEIEEGIEYFKKDEEDYEKTLKQGEKEEVNGITKNKIKKAVLEDIKKTNPKLYKYITEGKHKEMLKKNGEYSTPFRITSQFSFCPNNFSADTYNFCEHGCVYCFAFWGKQIMHGHNKQGFFSASNGKVLDVEKWAVLIWLANKGVNIDGKYYSPDWIHENFYTGETSRHLFYLFKNKTPIHWGGNTDPFTPAEQKYGASLALLELYAELEYPVTFSTKTNWLTWDNPKAKPYIDALKRNAKNTVAQISLITTDKRLEVIEMNTTIEGRLNVIQTLLDLDIDVVIREQPYIPGLTDGINEEGKDILEEYIDTLGKMKGKNGKTITSLTTEFIKFPSMVPEKVNKWLYDRFKKIHIDFNKIDMDREGNDKVLHLKEKTKRMKKMKELAHKYKIAFYSAENELRLLGDGFNCCGIPYGKKGFEAFGLRNFNYIVFKMKYDYLARKTKDPNMKTSRWFSWKDFVELTDMTQIGFKTGRKIDKGDLIASAPVSFYNQVERTLANSANKKYLLPKYGINDLEKELLERNTFYKTIKMYWYGEHANSPHKFFRNIERKKDIDGEVYYRYNDTLLEKFEQNEALREIKNKNKNTLF